MNTFITDSDPIQCAKDLDNKRLGKQRLECVQILTSITNNKGWIHHPCTKMWIPYIDSLKYYTNCMIDEWVSRGFKNTMEKFTDFKTEMPWWFHSEELQKSHKASLLRKDFDFYSNKFDKSELEDYMEYTYVWITKIPEDLIIKLKNKEKIHISHLTTKIL